MNPLTTTILAWVATIFEIVKYKLIEWRNNCKGEDRVAKQQLELVKKDVEAPRKDAVSGVVARQRKIDFVNDGKFTWKFEEQAE